MTGHGHWWTVRQARVTKRRTDRENLNHILSSLKRDEILKLIS